MPGRATVDAHATSDSAVRFDITTPPPINPCRTTYPVSSENTEAFPFLSAADLALVEHHGVRRSIDVGDYLFRQGEQTNDFYAVLSGAVEIVVHADGTDRVITARTGCHTRGARSPPDRRPRRRRSDRPTALARPAPAAGPALYE